MSLLLVVACMGLLASCGGSGATTSEAVSTPPNLPDTALEKTNDGVIYVGYMILIPKSGVSISVAREFLQDSKFTVLSYTSSIKEDMTRIPATSLREFIIDLTLISFSNL